MSRKHHDMRRAQKLAFALTANTTDAQVLATIWSWEPYATVARDGERWVVKTDKDFIEQDGIMAAARTIRASIERLKVLGLLKTMRGRHPNGRAPNSRYIRLTDKASAALENDSESGAGSHNCIHSNEDNAAPSTRREAPLQDGNRRRVHRQGNGNTTDTRTNIGDQRPVSGPVSNDSIREKPTHAQEDIALEAIQIGFDKGCRARMILPHPAPALINPSRLRALSRFAKACSIEGLTVADTASVAERFAKFYCPYSFAKLFGREMETVSQNPDHFVLYIAANHAIADWKNDTYTTGSKPLPDKSFKPYQKK